MFQQSLGFWTLGFRDRKGCQRLFIRVLPDVSQGVLELGLLGIIMVEGSNMIQAKTRVTELSRSGTGSIVSFLQGYPAVEMDLEAKCTDSITITLNPKPRLSVTLSVELLL